MRAKTIFAEKKDKKDMVSSRNEEESNRQETTTERADLLPKAGSNSPFCAACQICSKKKRHFE